MISLNSKHLILQADIFGAGTDTTLSSILWNILFLAARSGQINPEVTEGQMEDKLTKGQIKKKSKRGQNNLEATEGQINLEASKGQIQAEATKGQIKEESSKEVRNSQTSRDALCDPTSKLKNRFSQNNIRRKLLDDNVIDIVEGRLFRYEMYILASDFLEKEDSHLSEARNACCA